MALPRYDYIYQIGEARGWWLPASGNPIRISDMEDSHIDNLRAFMLRNAQHWQMLCEWDASRYMMDAPDDVWSAHDQEFNLPADWWVKDTPLWKALEAEKRRRAGKVVREAGQRLRRGVVHSLHPTKHISRDDKVTNLGFLCGCYIAGDGRYVRGLYCAARDHAIVID